MSSLSTPRFSGWRMVAIFFFAQNTVYGLLFGTYGILIASVAAEYRASGMLIALGLPLAMAGQGIFAPLAAMAMGRFSIRSVLVVGALLLAAGYALAGMAQSAWQFVLAVGGLGGAAAACLGYVSGTTLISNWFVHRRARAIGIAMVPLYMMVLPTLAAIVTTHSGWRVTCWCACALALLLIPALRFVHDRPGDVGQRALGAADCVEPTAQEEDSGRRMSLKPLRQKLFLMLVIFASVITAASIVITTFLISFATGTGVELRAAGLLLSVLAIAGFPGAFVFGIVADRIGGARTLALMAAIQCIAWPCLLLQPNYPMMAALVGLIGLSANGLTPSIATLLANLYGQRAFAHMMGLYTMAAMPLCLLIPLAAGVLNDWSGGYSSVFLAQAALLGASAIALFRIGKHESAAHPPA